MATEIIRFQFRRGTAAEWAQANPVLADGEPGIEKDTGKQKNGDGVRAWNALRYTASKGGPGPAGVADDNSVKTLITTPGSQTAAALSATYEPKGAAATAAAAPKLERSQRGWEQIRSQNYKALIPWYAALGNRDTTPAKIIWLGDSVTEGLGASARPGTKRYVDRVLTRIRAQYPTTGIGAGGGAGYYPTQYAGGPNLANVTYGGTTTADLTASGLGLRSRILDSTDDYVQWTGLQGTSVDLLYQKKSATAVLGWSVDGGAVTNLETMGSGGADTGTLRIPLGASGAHTLRVAYVSGGSVQPEGVYVYDGDETKGIHIYEAGPTLTRLRTSSPLGTTARLFAWRPSTPTCWSSHSGRMSFCITCHRPRSGRT